MINNNLTDSLKIYMQVLKKAELGGEEERLDNI